MNANGRRFLRLWFAFALLTMGSLSASGVEKADLGAVTIPRIQYGGGGDWYTDPTSIPNLLKAANERFSLVTKPDNLSIKISDPQLFTYPMIYLTGHGNVKFEDHEINRLLTYLESGGFLWVDDCYGIDRSFRREMKKLFPDKELSPIPTDHPIFNLAYEMPKGLPKIHEHDGKPPQAFGIFSKGRMVVFYTFETDIGDGIEDAGVHPEDSAEKREEAMKMALNILFFALNQ